MQGVLSQLTTSNFSAKGLGFQRVGIRVRDFKVLGSGLVLQGSGAGFRS